jgi:signal transduction histidine kinase
LVLATRGGYRLRARRVAALQAARESAQRQERLRLSQDLHDQLGAELTQMVLAGGHARRQLAQNQLPDAKLAQIESTAQGLVESLAEIVWLTKPTNDTLDQLANYLGDLTSSMLEKAGLECILEIPTDLPNAPVSYDLRHDLVLAVKEALHNAIKHAGAHAVSLTIKTTATEMSMVVRDSGRGFGEDTARTSGNGINHMKARLAKHGGSATVASTPEGVVVTFTVPWSRT